MRAPLPLPALHATHAGIWIAAAGEVREASRGQAISRLADTPHIILNAPLVGQRLGYADVSGLDLLELFAFVHPARFAVPTVAGLARATGIEPPNGESEAAAKLVEIAESLLGILADHEWPEREGAWTSNATLHRLGWGWAPFIGQRLDKPERGERMLFSRLPASSTSTLACGSSESRVAMTAPEEPEPMTMKSGLGDAKSQSSLKRADLMWVNLPSLIL